MHESLEENIYQNQTIISDHNHTPAYYSSKLFNLKPHNTTFPHGENKQEKYKEIYFIHKALLKRI